MSTHVVAARPAVVPSREGPVADVVRGVHLVHVGHPSTPQIVIGCEHRSWDRCRPPGRAGWRLCAADASAHPPRRAARGNARPSVCPSNPSARLARTPLPEQGRCLPSGPEVLGILRSFRWTWARKCSQPFSKATMPNRCPNLPTSARHLGTTRWSSPRLLPNTAALRVASLNAKAKSRVATSLLLQYLWGE